MTETEQHPEAFRVTGQQHMEEPDEHGRMRGHFRVHFETPSGVQSHITIPEELYTAPNVAAEIADRAGEIEKVQALTHG